MLSVWQYQLVIRHRRQAMKEARINIEHYKESGDPIFLAIVAAWIDFARRETRKIFGGSTCLRKTKRTTFFGSGS